MRQQTTSRSDTDMQHLGVCFGILRAGIKEKLMTGRVLPNLSAEARVALMHDKMLRFLDTHNNEELLDLAIDAFMAFSSSIYKSELIEEEGFNYDEEEIREAVLGPRTPQGDEDAEQGDTEGEETEREEDERQNSSRDD